MGISPKKEKEKSNLPIRLTKGQYLTETDDGILIGEGLANYLNVSIGDTLAFIGQGYHGSSAAGLFPIRGLLHLPIIEMDNGLVYMTLQTAQTFIDMPDGYSGVLISIKKESMLNETLSAVSSQLSVVSGQLSDSSGENTKNYYEILPWTTTMGELMKTAESHKGMVRMVMMILYLIVGFGILGTVIMMTNERKREFAMMISLGMSRGRLKVVTLFELILLTMLGVLLAIGISIPLTLYFSYNPIQMTGDMAKSFDEMGMEAIMPMIVDTRIFITQAITVFVFTCLTFIYPIRKIRKLKIMNNRV
jgi:ABC-type lipoprotein release transport system permease subunit